MVDPKMVELPGYNGIPHLLGKVITDVEQVMGALTWLMLQMDDRYQLFRDAGVRNIEAYNELAMRKQQGRPAAALHGAGGGRAGRPDDDGGRKTSSGRSAAWRRWRVPPAFTWSLPRSAPAPTWSPG